MRKQKCYIYMRVSTAMQIEGYSLEAQKDRLTKFAQFQDMEIVREYCDAGKSGKNITGRPEFSRMLQDVAEEKDGVLLRIAGNGTGVENKQWKKAQVCSGRRKSLYR